MIYGSTWVAKCDKQREHMNIIISDGDFFPGLCHGDLPLTRCVRLCIFMQWRQARLGTDIELLLMG